MFGFLNVYKPKGITSHDVVAQLRKATGIKQIGHTGTLDPFAEGVLPVCIGKATRLIEFLDDDKEYLATVQFGKETDTYDLEGNVTKEYEQIISESELTEQLKHFEGKILQTPPIYSALKVNGKKLYEYAREGKSIEVQPREVEIYKIELISFDDIKQQAEILIGCSKGTYIRSIAYDLGKNLNCGGHLIKLIRTKAGKFTLEKSIKDYTNNISDNIINPIDIIGLPKININDEEHGKVLQGQYLNNHSKINNEYLILIYNDRIDAIAFAEEDKIRVKKVFV